MNSKSKEEKIQNYTKLQHIQSEKSHQIIIPKFSKKISNIFTKCLQQNQNFKIWHQKKNWRIFHSSHYDWWAFPINERSSHGETYMVNIQEIQIMKNSPQFLQTLSENAQMVCQAWGYNLTKGQIIKTQHQDQRWQNWPIRLYKMTKSLEIFQLKILFNNAVRFGCMLIKDGKKFSYNRKELSKYFLEKQGNIFHEIKQQKIIKQIDDVQKPKIVNIHTIKNDSNKQSYQQKSKI